MPRSTLTDVTIKRLPAPTDGTRTHWDGNTRGLGLRISPSGTKTFIVLIGSGRRQALGRYPSLSLSDARTEARRVLAEKTLGKIRPARIAFDDAKVEFLAECERKNKPRTLVDYTRLLKKFSFTRTPLADITPQNIRSAVSSSRVRSGGAKPCFCCGARVFPLGSPATLHRSLTDGAHDPSREARDARARLV